MNGRDTSRTSILIITERMPEISIDTENAIRNACVKITSRIFRRQDSLD